MEDCLCDYPGEYNCLTNIKAKNKAHGRTALHLAARYNRPSCIKTLVEDGADIEARDNYGSTPMRLAAWKNHCNSMTVLASLHARRDKLGKTNSKKLRNCLENKNYDIKNN